MSTVIDSPILSPFEMIVDALTELASRDRAPCGRTIALNCSSSHLSVRAMCRAYCRGLRFYPPVLRDQFLEDQGLLLPDEGFDLADICIRIATDEDSLRLLALYMCNEFLAKPNGRRYKELRVGIAFHMGEMAVPGKAALVTDWTACHFWMHLPKYMKTTSERRAEINNSLLHLMADVFSSMQEESLRLLQDERVPERCQRGILPIWRVFAQQLAERYQPARGWLQKLAEQFPSDRCIQTAWDTVQRCSESEHSEVAEKFAYYMRTGDIADCGVLRSRKHNEQVLASLRSSIGASCCQESAIRIVRLLREFEGRSRSRVVRLLLDHWELLSTADYDLAVETLTLHGVPMKADCQHARDLLQRDLQNSEASSHVREAAKKGLLRILEQ